MSGFETIALIAGLASSAVSAVGSIVQGNAEKDAQYEAARQEEAQGKDELAAAQRDAQERKLEGDLILSRQQALAAASGGGAGSDAPTIVKLMTRTAERSKFGQDSALYGGEQRRKGLFDSAVARRKSGDASFLGGLIGAAGDVASGVGGYARRKA